MADDSTLASVPFYESIVPRIFLAGSKEKMREIGGIIMATEILVGHDRILLAWNERVDDVGFFPDHQQVVDYVMEQKRLHTAVSA